MTKPRREPRASDLLAVDVGNSKVQAVLILDGRERFRWRVPYASRPSQWKRPFAKAVQWAAVHMHPQVPVLLASVAPARAAVIKRLLREAGLAAIHPVSWRDPWPFRLGLQRPESVGADRLANVAGLVALGLRRGVAVDVGTAVTIDVLEEGKFTGGLILPGAALMSEALHRHTALLPRVAWRHPVPLVGGDTESALRAGIVHGLIEAIRGLTEALRSRLGADAVAVVTGGCGVDVARSLPFLRSEPDLTFLGMQVLAARFDARARRRPGFGKKRR